MAVALNGTNQAYSAASAPKSAVPLTIAARFNPSTVSGLHNIVNISSGGGNFCLLGQDGNLLRGISAVSFTEVQFYSSNTFSVDTWSSGVARFNSTTNRQITLNGVTPAADTNSSNPTSMGNTAVGSFQGTSGNLFAGRVCDVAVWNVGLTDAEVAAYTAGYSPMMIRPNELLAYWPLFIAGNAVPLKGSITLTANNTPTAFAHPAVRFPRKASRIIKPVTVAGVSLNQIERGWPRGIVRGMRAA